MLAGATYEGLAAARDRIMAAAANYPGLINLDSDYKESKPQMRIETDLQRAGDLGVSVNDVSQALQSLLGSRRVTTYVDRGEEYRVLVQAEDEGRETVADLERINVRSRTGALVPLSSLVTVKEVAGPRQLNRYNKLRAITLTAALAPGTSLGDALTWLEGQARQSPEVIALGYRGESQSLRETGGAIWLVFGLTIGIVAALRRNKPADHGLMIFSFVSISAPQFVIGILLLYVFAVKLGWFPIGGYGTFGHVVLPAVTLGFLGAGWYSRMMRSSMIDVLGQDFVRTARAKGLGKARIILRHVIPNSILPIIAMIGIDIGLFMSGIVVVESVFGWPGIGQLAWQAIQRVDIPVIMGVTMVSATAIVLGNLLADLVAPAIDPRIKTK
ncbi:MAG: efflux RND transporter permease subunit [Pseudomonadota bacterium]|nr:efflux RND transporter permease subunit [Pseudomonadota bacterium]